MPLQRFKDRLKDFLPHGYHVKSYSQEGEDMILRRYFESRKHGFYVDVGSCHPKRFSNTYFFYRRGWRGINIEPRPGSRALFQQMRPFDINLEAAIASSRQTRTYYIFQEMALNSFSEKLCHERATVNGERIRSEIPISTMRLDEVLEAHLPKGTTIDFLTVDVEGMELEVLQSNNWKEYSPDLVLVELLLKPTDVLEERPEWKFLLQHGYLFFAKTVKTYFFRRARFSDSQNIPC